MDAGDEDIKIQRASGDLLTDFTGSLPRFLWRASSSRGEVLVGGSGAGIRCRVKTREAERLIALVSVLPYSCIRIKLICIFNGKLEPFQEWPQLLDPHLSTILPLLISAFIAYLNQAIRENIYSKTIPSKNTIPLHRSICKLLYTLCKIRGEKVVSRFFNNEPRYLEPLLLMFEVESSVTFGPEHPIPVENDAMIWEERYVMLLWLSHLLLAPFDLASISSGDTTAPTYLAPDLSLPLEIPSITARIIPICLEYLSSSSKERESARALLVRLSLRKDMRRLGVLKSLVQWALTLLGPNNTQHLNNSVYYHIGLLSFTSGLLVSTDLDAIIPHIFSIFQTIHRVATEESPKYLEIRSSAQARKLIIKIYRAITILFLQSEASEDTKTELPTDLLETVIDHFLTSLEDKDTPVRYAASKALSIITAKLKQDMASEVVEAVIGSLAENVLWERAPGAEYNLQSKGTQPAEGPLKRNLAAVNPLRWHGLTLTLAHLLFRRSPPPGLLPDILNALILALGFEQRSSTRSSIGNNVRDSACFGIWALSRRYTPGELAAVNTSTIPAANDGHGADMSVPQVLATELIAAASLDPSGNIRRGASAALQELIGRHPDTVINGIPLVQAVDYHTVARYSRAVTQVAVSGAALGEVYWNAVFDGILGWRGIGSPDGPSRRLAAQALGLLVDNKPNDSSPLETVACMVKRISNQLSSLTSRQVEERHGLFLALSEIADAVWRKYGDTAQGIEILQSSSLWSTFDQTFRLTEEDFTSSVLRPDLTAEAVSRLISSLTGLYRCPGAKYPPIESINRWVSLSMLSLLRPEENAVVTASQTTSDIFSILSLKDRQKTLESWTLVFEVDNIGRPGGTNRFGHVAALGQIFKHFIVNSYCDGSSLSDEQKLIIDILVARTGSDAKVEYKVASLNSIKSGILSEKVLTNEMVDMLRRCLDDYSSDSRGDIGSWVRIEAIDAVAKAWQMGLISLKSSVEEMLVSRVIRLSGEKLDKVRFRGWIGLKAINPFSPASELNLEFNDVSHTASYSYFRQLLSLLSSPDGWIREPLLEGYVTSAGAGSESVVNASRLALIDFLDPISVESNSSAFTLTILYDIFLSILRGNIANDRVAVPLLEVLSFLFDTRVGYRLENTLFDWRPLFSSIQRAHFKSGNVHKLEGAIKAYTGLSEIKAVQRDVIAKLISMLLHPFPKIRNAAADSLYLFTSLKEKYSEAATLLKESDWSVPPKTLKKKTDLLKELIS
ncbi:MAG: hypothetical protein M1829_003181 [Trizodia sp. TS-e1964]|nr:MAG: hypothetical protein M1829_003181 [Trizodia sp. TS-e1964]